MKHHMVFRNAAEKISLTKDDYGNIYSESQVLSRAKSYEKVIEILVRSGIPRDNIILYQNLGSTEPEKLKVVHGSDTILEYIPDMCPTELLLSDHNWVGLEDPQVSQKIIEYIIKFTNLQS